MTQDVIPTVGQMKQAVPETEGTRAVTGDWGEPEQVAGERVNPSDILNHLIIVWVIDYIAHSPTKFTRPDKPSDVIVVDVCDLDLADDEGFQGRLSRKAWWRQARLIASLKPKIGTRLLGRIVKGTANSGFNAPFEFVSMVGDADCLKRGDIWMKAHPNFKPSEPGIREINAELDGKIAQSKPQTVVEPTVLERVMMDRLNDSARAGAERLTGTTAELPPPPPMRQSEKPPF